MANLIDRDALLEKCRSWNGRTWQHNMCLEKDIRNAPVIDAEPVRHGWWQEIAQYSNGDIFAECSLCETRIGTFCRMYDYCPACGAKMDLEESP